MTLYGAGISKNVVIGFLDESSHHTNVNTSRLWSFGKLRIKKNTAKKERVNSFGFYALNGESVYSTKDSFSSHRSFETKKAAEDLVSYSFSYRLILLI
jgi:hypothetical protein